MIEQFHLTIHTIGTRSGAKIVRVRKRDVAPRASSGVLLVLASSLQSTSQQPLMFMDLCSKRSCERQLLGILGEFLGKEGLTPQFLKLRFRSYFPLQVTLSGQLFELPQEFSAILRRGRQFSRVVVERHRTILHVAVCTPADHPASDISTIVADMDFVRPGGCEFGRRIRIGKEVSYQGFGF